MKSRPVRAPVVIGVIIAAMAIIGLLGYHFLARPGGGPVQQYTQGGQPWLQGDKAVMPSAK